MPQALHSDEILCVRCGFRGFSQEVCVIHRATFRLLILLLCIFILAACGGSDGDEVPLPTQFDVNAAATERAAQNPTQSLLGLGTTATITPLPPADTPSPAPTQTPLPIPSPEPPTVTLTSTPTAIPLPTATPTNVPIATVDVVGATAQAEATGIALTNTAIAGVQPFTQTAAAMFANTVTAAASITPTPTPTITFTPPPGPLEPYQIVFYTNRHGNDDLYLLALDGAEHRLTGSPANEREPSCAPDGSAVVFASDASGSWQIYLLPMNGTIPIQLTDSAGMNFAPVFSPDGRQIAFVSTRNEGIPTIWVMNADGSSPRQITTILGRDTTPSWGPDGRQLLFAGEQFGPWDLFLTILEEGVEGEFPLMPPEFNVGNQLWPSFDPLGERIVYSTWGDLNDPQTADIYMLDFELPEPVPVRVEPGADIAWGWGDDTHLIASVGGPDDVQIALIDVTTGETVRLTNAPGFNGGGRLCTVPRDVLPPEVPLAPSPTPTKTPLPTLTPTVTFTPAPSPIAFSPQMVSASGHQHVIQPGDTLMNIGYRYGVNWHDLAVLNKLPNPDRLRVGDALIVPVTRVGRFVSGYQHPDSNQVLPMSPRKEIVVELEEQEVHVYEGGRQVKIFTVSTGLPGTPTVEGEFSIYYKIEMQPMRGPGYYLSNVEWVMFFYEGYGLHGTYWHNNFGEPMSHGCVNLANEDARWLYEWAEIGTPVLVRQ